MDFFLHRFLQLCCCCCCRSHTSGVRHFIFIAINSKRNNDSLGIISHLALYVWECLQYVPIKRRYARFYEGTRCVIWDVCVLFSFITFVECEWRMLQQFSISFAFSSLYHSYSLDIFARWVKVYDWHHYPGTKCCTYTNKAHTFHLELRLRMNTSGAVDEILLCIPHRIEFGTI